MMNYKPQYYALLLSSMALSHTALMAKSQDKAPNILFIFIDDLRPQIGAYGFDYMVTPNLDNLASKGRLFSQHYVQVPTSGASRAAMLTGMYPSQRGDLSNETFGTRLIGAKEGEYPETFIHHLKRNGYYTLGMGKVSHHGNGHKEYNGTQALELPNSWDRYVNDPAWIWKGDDILHAYADGGTRDDGHNPAFESLDLPDESFPDGRLAKMAVSELELLAKKSEPFFMAVGFYKPHLPFCSPLKYWNMYDEADIELSPVKEAPEGVDKIFVHGSLEFKNQYSHPHEIGSGIVVPDEYARDVRHAYCAAISYTDAQVGKVLTKLEELGLADNTIIVVWGDHGWHLGDHTIWGKHSTFDRSLNSTFMVVTPDMKQPGVTTDGLIATVDIYPTICQLAGVTPPKGLDGVSIVPILDDPEAKTRESVPSYWQNMLTVKTERYRLSLFDRDQQREIMLFDHKNDPNESVNVADKNPEVVAELMAKLKEYNKPDLLPGLK